MLLDYSSERASAEEAIITLLREPCSRAIVEFDSDIAVGELLFELQHELLDDPSDRLGG